MENIDLLVDLAFAMGAALIGGFLAHLVRQPAILGYLVAGIVVGPYTPGPTSSVERVQTLANLGVTLLMFALGTEFSLDALKRVRNVAVYGGLIQIALNMGLGTALGLLLGYSLQSAVFLGGVIAISSSIIMLKLLLARDEVESIVGRAALGIGIVQDLAMVALIIILPSLSGQVGLELLGTSALAVLKGGAFLVVAYLLGTRLVPPILERIARVGSRELFLLFIVAIAAGTSVLGQIVGISFALGAFLAGLIVSESEYSHHVLDEIIPIRDIFATLFFVSIGMLIDPAFLAAHVVEITLLVAVILVGKFIICAAVIRLFGYSARNAVRAGLLLAQIGEFSFVLASEGLHRGTIDNGLYTLVLAGALVTLILNPILIGNIDRLADPLSKLLLPLDAVLRSREQRRHAASATAEVAIAPEVEDAELHALKDHVIVCGYGRVGREVTHVLHERGVPSLTIDYTPARVEQATEDGVLCVQGDATYPSTLERVGIGRARMLLVTLPDLPSTETVVRYAREMNPKVDIVARTSEIRAIAHLKQAGANTFIQPEFEAGVEMVRQVLRKYGVSPLETHSILGSHRQYHYKGPLVDEEA